MRTTHTTIQYHYGVGLGTVIAILLSWVKWHALGWAIFHGLLGWFYVIYHLLTYGVPK